VAAIPDWLKDGWHRAQAGWPRRFPLVQMPNAPLLAALTGWAIAAVSDGSLHAYARAALYAFLAAWAWEELASGVNWFRRALGVAGLVYVTAKVGVALGG
jgi:hypothetical protein